MKTSVANVTLTLRYDPRHDYARGGWWARLQEDRGSILVTVTGGEMRDKSAFRALNTVADPLVPGWELTDEQKNTLGRNCGFLESRKGWAVTLKHDCDEWEASVEDTETDKIVGLSSRDNPPEALIRALDKAIASPARWI